MERGRECAFFSCKGPSRAEHPVTVLAIFVPPVIMNMMTSMKAEGLLDPGKAFCQALVLSSPAFI